MSAFDTDDTSLMDSVNNYTIPYDTQDVPPIATTSGADGVSALEEGNAWLNSIIGTGEDYASSTFANLFGQSSDTGSAINAAPADITGTSSDSDLLGTIGKYMNKVSADTWAKIGAGAIAGFAKSKAAEKDFQLKEKEYQLKKDKDTRAATSNANLKLPTGLIGSYNRMTGAKA